MTCAQDLHSCFSTGDSLDDRTLVERAMTGDDRAFAVLVERHYERALRVAFGFVKSQTEAQDVVQDAFMKVYTRLSEFRAASGFYTWLYRIVVNLSIDRLRRLRRERRVDLSDEEGREAMAQGQELWPGVETSNPHQNLSRRQLRGRLSKAFSSLPEIHQSVLMLREVEGQSYEEIADTLGIKKGTVMSRLFHARKAMQQQLNKMDRHETERVSFSFAFSEGKAAAAAFAMN